MFFCNLSIEWNNNWKRTALYGFVAHFLTQRCKHTLSTLSNTLLTLFQINISADCQRCEKSALYSIWPEHHKCTWANFDDRKRNHVRHETLKFVREKFASPHSTYRNTFSQPNGIKLPSWTATNNIKTEPELCSAPTACPAPELRRRRRRKRRGIRIVAASTFSNTSCTYSTLFSWWVLRFV